MTSTPTATATVLPPKVLGVAASSITRSGATITWTTNIPATSEVEFGTGVGGPQLDVDASLVTSHRQVLAGLLPGTAYRYRARSTSANGTSGVSSEGVFSTAPAGTGPEVSSVTVRRLTATTALIGWTAGAVAASQVEYGTTPSYQSFTLLQIAASPTQEMLLTGLQPHTNYHFRVKAWDAAGYLGASGDATFTTAALGQTTLVGDLAFQTESVTLASGQAAAYQYTATQSGQASVVRLYLDPFSNATSVRVALYSDQGGSPGLLLAQGSAPTRTGWMNVDLPPVSLVQGTRYWIAVLSPIGAGSLSLRDAGVGGSSQLSRQVSMATFPVSWSTGAAAARSPMSAYVQQLAPSVTLTEPAEGAMVTGRVTLSAVVDDDAPIARVQFYVDGLPVGIALVAAPYTLVWDSTATRSGQPHTITARALDTVGRSAASGGVGVQVDNGPGFLNVVANRGLTASSARVSWTTDVLADGQVEFGPTTAYGSTTPIDHREVWAHDMQITGLAPATTYHYRVRSRDSNGALAVSQDFIFASPVSQDFTLSTLEP